VRIFVGVTDNEWFRFLRSRPNLDEVNFWQPSGRTHFRAIHQGELFLFKLHAPENFIVGGGFLAYSNLMPYRLAWECFGEANGVVSVEQMRLRIARYRRQDLSPGDDPTIGCIMLAQPFFFERSHWIPLPADFSLSIQRGKRYRADEETGRLLWEQVQERLHYQPSPGPLVRQYEILGEPVLVRPRLGQGTFRALVTDLYGRQCAVSREKALPVLDASHIRPVADGGQHSADNGLLFRADIHRLFDRGYVTVTKAHRFRVSRRLKTDFDNGEPYYPFDGQQVLLPRRLEDRPRSEYLEWHSDVKFLS
jgi:putative restriction endonuclease